MSPVTHGIYKLDHNIPCTRLYNRAILYGLLHAAGKGGFCFPFDAQSRTVNDVMYDVELNNLNQYFLKLNVL